MREPFAVSGPTSVTALIAAVNKSNAPVGNSLRDGSKCEHAHTHTHRGSRLLLLLTDSVVH